MTVERLLAAGKVLTATPKEQNPKNSQGKFDLSFEHSGN
jgi:hypothetical protein